MHTSFVNKSSFTPDWVYEKCASFFRGIKNNPKETLATVAITLFVVGALIFAGNPLAGGLLMMSGALLGIATGLLSKYVSKEKTVVVDSEDGKLNKVMRLPAQQEITAEDIRRGFNYDDDSGSEYSIEGVIVTVKCNGCEDCPSAHEERLI